MKLSFKQVISSDAYQKQAERFVKMDIFIAIVAMLYTILFNERIFTSWEKLKSFVWAVAGTSLFISMPVFLAICFFAVVLSGNSEFPSGRPTNSMGYFSSLMIKLILPLLSLILSWWAARKFMGV